MYIVLIWMNPGTCKIAFVFVYIYISFLQSNYNLSQNKFVDSIGFCVVLELKCSTTFILFFFLCHLPFRISWMRILFQPNFKLVFTISTDSWANLWLLTAITTTTTKNHYPRILLSCLMGDSQVLSLFASLYFRQNAVFVGMAENERNETIKSHQIWLF